MRRWWLWPVGVIVVGALGFVALAFILPPGVPFDFLSGRQPVQLNMRAQDRRMLERMAAEYSIYSFEGDFAAVKEEADKELRAAGFSDAPQSTIGDGGMTVTYVRGNPFGIGTSSTTSSSGDDQLVGIMKDTRITSDTPVAGQSPEGNHKGWVSVVVAGQRKKGIFETFRDWLGF